MNRCYSCFKEYDEGYEICPYCGTIWDDNPQEPIYLKPGTVLSNRYIIGEFAGSGGFGIIYKAWDTTLEVVVAVKEFYTSRLMTRAEGNKEVIISKKDEIRQEFEYRKQRFLAEARNMAKFSNHRSIPNVYEYFEENGTAYIVMELLVGQGLNDYLRQSEEKVDRDFAIHVVNEVGKALISLHEKGIIHRDVAPDNIFICSEKDIKIKLLDLGAASLQDSTDASIDKILKPGYSPVEQYNDTQNIGSWTDVYALGATLYVMLTGIKPDESTNRKISDTLVPPHELDDSIPENLSNAVMKAMSIEKNLRFKKVEDFLKAINGEKKVMSLAKEKKRLQYRRFTGVAVACLMVAVIVGIVGLIYSSMTLQNASIEIWYYSDSDGEELAMNEIKNEFKKHYKNIEIKLRNDFASFNDYKAEITTADKNGKLPDLFESTGIDDSFLSSAADIQDVLDSEQAKECMFLDDYNNAYGQSRKKVPLAIGVPVAYVVTNGKYMIDKSEASDAFTNSFIEKYQDMISVEKTYASLFENNGWSDITGKERKAFLNPGISDESAAVLYASTEMYYKVEEALNMVCVWECVFPKGRDIECHYTYEWSVGKNGGNNQAAAKKLLSWMLGTEYQNILLVKHENRTYIPVNEDCFKKTYGNNTTKRKFGYISTNYGVLKITEGGFASE